MYFLYIGLLVVIAILFAIYQLSKWVLKKLKCGNEKNRKFIAIIPTALLPIIGVGILAGAIYIHDQKSRTYYYFSEYSWQETPSSRKSMSTVIIEENILGEKTKQEVIELLGPDFHYWNEHTIFYYLGSCPYLPLKNPDILLIEFLNEKTTNVSQSKYYNLNH